MIYPDDGGKIHRTDLIVDDGGGMTILVHKGKKSEDLFLKYFTIHDPISMGNAEFKIVQTIIKHQLEGGEKYDWNKIVNTCMRVFEDTSMVFHHLYGRYRH